MQPRRGGGGGFVPAISSVLTVILWPVRLVFSVLFPFSETDGLSSAVTEKAAQSFVQYLRSVASGNDVFSTSSFTALKEEATSHQSLIFLYLHSPFHHQSREACERLLNQDPILSFLQQDSVIAYGVSIHTGQGAHLQNLLSIECFPALAILQPGTTARSSLNLLLKAEGMEQCSPGYLMPRLHVIQQTHQATLTDREVRRMHREQEEELRRQQDAEFEATLQADRERERKVQEERAAELEREEEERIAKEEEENKVQRLRDSIEPEPESSGAEMRFCLPSGAKLTRRFRPDQTVGDLKDYIRIYCIDNSIPMGDIGLSTNFPRKVYEENDLTLQDTGLAPRAVLMVQDLDA